MTIRSLIVGGGGGTMTATGIARALLARGMNDAQIRAAIGGASDIVAGLTAVLSTPIVAPAPPPPLRIATTNLRGPGARLQPSSSRTVHQQRTRHFVAGRKLTSITVAFFTYTALDVEIDRTPHTVDKVAVEIGGISYPLTKGGQRSCLIDPSLADADKLIIFDERPVSVAYGTEIALRIQASTETGAYWPHSNSGTIASLTTGAGGFVDYNAYTATPANAIDQIDAVGPLAAPTGAQTNYLSLPFILLGRFENDEVMSVLVYGDSIGEGLDSGNYSGNGVAVPSVAGGGYVHIAQVDANGANPIAVFNFSRAGAVLGADGATGFALGLGTRRLGLLKYAKAVYVPLGINDLSAGPAGRTEAEMLVPFRNIWQSAKAGGVKVLQPLYTPRTSPAVFPITSISVSGTVATAVLGVPLADTGLTVGAGITVAGATPTGYNGAKTITGVTAGANSITFDVASGLAAATGTLTFQYTNPLANAKSQAQYIYGSDARIALNARFLALVGTEIDAVARVDLIVGHPDDRTKWSTNPVLCSTGRLHPNAQGHALMAPVTRQAIFDLLASPPKAAVS